MPAEFIDLGDDHSFWPARRCEWRLAPSKQWGGPRIRFLISKHSARREFFIEPMVKHWLRGAPTRCVDDLCAHGAKIRAGCSGAVKLSPALHKLLLRLFRNRNSGHWGYSRCFRHAIDFVATSPGEEASLILPGIDSEAVDRNGRNQRASAFRQLRALGDPAEVDEGASNLERVLGRYEMLLASDSPPRVRSNTPSLAQSFDGLFIDGWTPEVDYDVVAKQVRSALIAGPVTDADIQAAFGDREVLEHFLARLWRESENRSPRAFDAWLSNHREHGFVRLLPPSLRDGIDARLVAQQIYAALLWKAYCEAARGWGVLMYVVFHTAVEQFDLNDDEQFAFKQHNFPQAYLGGLPLAFFGLAQLRWMVRSLMPLWYPTDGAAQTTTTVSSMLGIFSVVASHRREADREAKRSRGRRSEVDGQF